MTLAARSLSCLTVPLVLAACATTPPPDSRHERLALYQGRAAAGSQVAAIGPDTEQVLTAASLSLDAALQATFPNSAVQVGKSPKAAADDALTLRWKNIWKSGVGIQGAPVDLEPYRAQGTLAFDLKVDELARGGILFKVGCGEDCERPVSYVVPGRAAQGKGWRRIVLSMECFAREGDDFRAVRRPFTVEGTGSGEVSIANVVFDRAGTPNTACPDYRTVAVTPDTLNESWSLAWWMPRHLQKLEDIKVMKASGQSPELVFIGDSITQGWEKEGAATWQRRYTRYHALGLGFGGDRTENVLWRLKHGEVDGIDPKVAVLMFGTNNTGHRRDHPATTVAGIKRNIEELRRRLPDTRILLLAIFPRDETPDGAARRLNEQINAELPSLADNRKVFFMNINQAFLQADGRLSKEIMPDLLHPNEKGYEIWAAAMQPELERLMAMPR
ncbi:GDSL-type esterase/lipase family protein [Massilia niastensis]|uniref:GDSL-type esterase/lipase family protein n=1 Tax=Massilia niastensis TaxID=544911 RepID=UPI00035D2EB3|nr:GDSL-type esterase/lipase family protein [Massilia niastensis]